MANIRHVSVVVALVTAAVYAAPTVRNQIWSGSIAPDGNIEMIHGSASAGSSSPMRTNKANARGNLKASMATGKSKLYRGGRKQRKPNLIMFVADDFGWSDIGYHQGSSFPTPTHDRLSGDEGVRLENFYVNSVCTPTRSALYTGLDPHHSGMQGAVIFPGTLPAVPMGNWTIAERLKEGCDLPESELPCYSTHFVGKWHIGGAAWLNTPLGRGFDTFMGMINGGAYFYTKQVLDLDPGYDFFEQRGPYKSSWRSNHEQAAKEIKANSRALVDSVGIMGNWRYSEEYYREEFNLVLSNLAKQPDKPFLLVYAPQVAHDPLERPSSEKANAACSHVSLQTTDLPKEVAEPCGETYDGTKRWGGEGEDCRTMTERRQTLCAMVYYQDETLLMVEAALKNYHIWDDTLIWFTADNGGKLAETITFGPATISKGSASSNYPFRGGKATSYQGGVRVPAFVTGGLVPTTARNTSVFELLQHVDVVGTMLHLAGANANGIDGYNSWDVVVNKAPSKRTLAVLHADTSEMFSFFAKVIFGCTSCTEHIAFIEKDADGTLWKFRIGSAADASDVYSTNDDQNYSYEIAKAKPVTFRATYDRKIYNVSLFNLDADPEERENLAMSCRDKLCLNDPNMKVRLNTLVEKAFEEIVNPARGYVQPHDLGILRKDLLRFTGGSETGFTDLCLVDGCPKNQPSEYRCPANGQGFWAPFVAAPAY